MKRHKPLQRNKPLTRHKALVPKKARKANMTEFRDPKPRLPKRALATKPREKATEAESMHMTRVRKLGCWACRKDGRQRYACNHHIREGYGANERASHWEVIPLCEPHHQGNFASEPGEPRVLAFHGGERTWKARYGNEIMCLKEVWDELGLDFERLPELRGSEPPWWQAYKEGRLDSALTDEEARRILTFFHEEVVHE